MAGTLAGFSPHCKVELSRCLQPVTGPPFQFSAHKSLKEASLADPIFMWAPGRYSGRDPPESTVVSLVDKPPRQSQSVPCRFSRALRWRFGSFEGGSR